MQAEGEVVTLPSGVSTPTGLQIPTAVPINESGVAFAAVSALMPGEAEVIELSYPAEFTDGGLTMVSLSAP